MANAQNKTYRPAPFVPNTSYTGSENDYLIKGENMWLRYNRSGSMYAEGYTGNYALPAPETSIATKVLTGTLSWSSGSTTVTGSGTAFLSELYLGSFVFGQLNTVGATQLFVIEQIISNTEFKCSKAPDATASGKTGYLLPILFPIGINRGTALRGNALQYFKGHYLGVGDGSVRVNGAGFATRPFTTNFAVNNRLTFSAHGMAEGQQIVLSSTGTLPAGLSSSITYYVKYVSATEIEVALTSGGAAVTLTDNGTGTHSAGWTLPLSKTPQFALYSPTTNTYTVDDVGIDKPIRPPTLSSVAPVRPITPAAANSATGSAGTYVVTITTTADHHLFTGDKIVITGYAATCSSIVDGEYTITRLTSTTFTITVATALPAGSPWGPGAMVIDSPRIQIPKESAYNIRIVARNTETNGYSQPTPVETPITITISNCVKVEFRDAMHEDQNAYDIYSSEFTDYNTGTVEARYQGPWYLVKTVTADMLKNTGASTPTGREAGTFYEFIFSDAEINTSQSLLSFDNFAPVDAGFVDLINGIPIYFSCLGQGNAGKLQGSTPGPVAIPSKPRNPEAVLLDKAITTAGGDYIIGEFNQKARIYALCQNSLQTIVLTTLDEEPIAFRSLWNAGFRNPYNVAFVKEYLYGFSTQKIVRSVAGGDDTAMEFEFASDINNLITSVPCGHVLVGYDPKNRAVCFFHTAAERRSNYWVTKVYPFLIDKQIWNPPIILKKSNSDFIVTGVATIGESLVFLAGGMDNSYNVNIATYIFDGGDSDTKDWHLAWNYSDDGYDLHPKTVKGASLVGRFSSDTLVKTYGVKIEDSIDTDFGTADNTITFTNPSSTNIKRRRFRYSDASPYVLYSMYVSGSYTSSTSPDRFDELTVKLEINNSEN